MDAKIPQEERKEFVDALFDVLNASGAHTLSEVRKDRVKTISASFSSMKELPKETRNRILEFIMLLNLISRRLNDENRINQTEKILEKVPSLSRRARHEKQASTNLRKDESPHENPALLCPGINRWTPFHGLPQKREPATGNIC